MNRLVKAGIVLAGIAVLLGVAWFARQSPIPVDGTARLALLLRCAADTRGELSISAADARVAGQADALCRRGAIEVPAFDPGTRLSVTFAPAGEEPVTLELSLGAGISAAPDHWTALLELTPRPPYLAIGRL